jgi:NitT/TauT family transport system permease protein
MIGGATLRSPRTESEIAIVERQVLRGAGTADRRESVLRVLSPIAALAAIVALWQLAIIFLEPPGYLVPPPADVARAAVDEFPLLMAASAETMRTVAIAFAISTVVAMFVALLTYHSKVFNRAIYPLLVAEQAVPKVAVGPLIAIWFGFGVSTRAIMGILIALFPVMITMLVGFNSIPEEKILLAKIIGLSPRQTLLKIRLPQALPNIFGGLKLALALSAVGVIVGEFLGGGNGLGYVIMTSNHHLNTALLFAALLFLAIYSVTLFLFIELAERIAIPWKRHAN